MKPSLGSYRSNLARRCSSLARLQSAILFLKIPMLSPPFSTSAAFLLDTLSCPPGMRKASFSLSGDPGSPPIIALRLFTASRSFFTDRVIAVSFLPRCSCLRMCTPTTTSRINVTIPRATAAINAGDESLSGGVAVGWLYSHLAPMKPIGHWHTGPV